MTTADELPDWDAGTEAAYDEHLARVAAGRLEDELEHADDLEHDDLELGHDLD